MMNVQWTQLMGIAVYEAKMHWRRRPLKVIMLAISFSILVSMILIAHSISGADRNAFSHSEEITNAVVFITWAPISITLALLLPILIADTIPTDRQIGVRELLDSTALSSKVYLTGKMMGVWLAALSGAIVIMSFSGVGWWISLRYYDLVAYLEMWLIGVLFLIILNSGLSVLLAATQPTRRRAILMIGAVFSLSFIFGFSSGTWWDYFNPARSPIVLYYLQRGITSFDTSVTDLTFSIIIGLTELALAWLFVHTWFVQKERSA